MRERENMLISVRYYNLFEAPHQMRRYFLRSRLSQFTKFLCTSTRTTNTNKDAAGESISVRDAYQQLDKLDFMTAAKILFTTPPKNKKFGLDFHLVQLFFACMPSLAVYLVAQYARYEIKRMEAEREPQKKQQEELEKAKELERMKNDPEVLQLKVRLDALEEAVKEIAVESKKPSSSNLTKDQKGDEKDKPETIKPKSESKSDDKGTKVGNSIPDLDSGSLKPGQSPKDQKSAEKISLKPSNQHLKEERYPVACEIDSSSLFLSFSLSIGSSKFYYKY